MRSVLAICLVLASPLAHAGSLADDIALPKGFVVYGDVAQDDFNLRIFFNADNSEHPVEGKRASAFAHADPPNDALDGPGTCDRIATTLKAAGWKVVSTRPDPAFSARRDVRGTEEWTNVTCFASADVRIEVIEKGTSKNAITLEPPKGDAYATKDKDDFAFLKRFPGSKLTETRLLDSFFVPPEEAGEGHDVGPALFKSYALAAQISAHEFIWVYRTALAAAGWNIIVAVEPSDGQLIAHYAKNGQDVYILLSAHDTLDFQVADIGAAANAKKLLAELSKNGHVALYGIYFDTDKAELKPESDATLRQIVVLLRAAGDLKLEIQGHTDSAGDHGRNQVLSEQRAAAVRSYLIAAGIPEDRLTSAGYAETKPVGDNTTDEGRAKNRRVELVKR